MSEFAAPAADAPGPRVLVIGGGIAGLAAAWFVRRDCPQAEVSVLEATARIGGKLGLAELVGLPVETGAESVLARRPEALDLIAAVGLGERLVHPRTHSAGIWTRGRVRPMPAEQVMGVPTDLGALARTGIVSAAGVLRAMGDRTLPAVRSAADVSVGAYIRSRLGDEVLDRLIDPLLGGVYAGHADELSVFAAMPQIAEAVRAGRPLTSEAARVRAQARPGPVFAGVPGGVGALPAAVAAASGARVRTRATVQGLRRTAAGWSVLVRGDDGAATELPADAVVLAVPATPAARLLGEHARSAAAELAAIDYASMAVVTLVYPPSQAPPELVGSGFLVPAVDGQLIKAVTLSSAKWAWTARAAAAAGVGPVLRASVGRLGEEAVLQRGDDELAAAVAADVARATGVRERPVASLVSRWGGGLPQYAVGHLDRVRRIRAAVAAVPGLAVCGAAYDGVGIAACVASAERAAREVTEAVAARGTMAP